MNMASQGRAVQCSLCGASRGAVPPSLQWPLEGRCYLLLLLRRRRPYDDAREIVTSFSARRSIMKSQKRCTEGP